ncbi:MAG: hypothetical protein KC503_33085 [Myxococcales bacterium]|nr:hypothetical protein [Myxococcales bacterium]
MSSARLMALPLLAALIVAAPARAYLPAPYGGQAVVPLPAAVVTIDPAAATQPGELQVSTLVFDTLYTFGSRRWQLPHLARLMPECNQAGTSCRIRLRADIKLHDGRILDAAAVAASLHRTKRGPHGYLLANVTSIRAEGIDAIRLTLRHRASDLAVLLSTPATAIAVRRGSRLVGSGPFRVARRRPRHIELVAHAECFAGRPRLDRLVFKAFKRSSTEVASFHIGHLTLSRHGKSAFGGRPRYAAEEALTQPRTLVYLAVGKRPEYLRDPLVRRALLAAIDRKRLSKVADTGPSRVAHGPVDRGILRYRRPRGARFSRGRANRLLARAAKGSPELRAAARSGRVQLSLLVDASRPDDKIAAGQLVADLDRIGIEARIETRDAASYRSRLAGGNYQLALARLPLQLPDGSLGVAAAYAAAGDQAAAARCVLKGCGAREARAFSKALPLLPLVHAGTRFHYDARLGPLAPDRSGRLPLADTYWRRRAANGGAAGN